MRMSPAFNTALRLPFSDPHHTAFHQCDLCPSLSLALLLYGAGGSAVGGNEQGGNVALAARGKGTWYWSAFFTFVDIPLFYSSSPWRSFCGNVRVRACFDRAWGSTHSACKGGARMRGCCNLASLRTLLSPVALNNAFTLASLPSSCTREYCGHPTGWRALLPVRGWSFWRGSSFLPLFLLPFLPPPQPHRLLCFGRWRAFDCYSGVLREWCVRWLHRLM
jgi:hypothetical protein